MVLSVIIKIVCLDPHFVDSEKFVRQHDLAEQNRVHCVHEEECLSELVNFQLRWDFRRKNIHKSEGETVFP
jgi:hypothetical protein